MDIFVAGYDLKSAQPWIFKMLAKRIKKSGDYPDLCHSQILDLLVRRVGYKDWNSYSALVQEVRFEDSSHLS